MISTACVCLQYGVFDSVHPSQFICHSHPTDTSPTKPHLHVLVTLTNKIVEGATGHVHGGILEVNDGHRDVRLPIVMKIAFGPDEVKQLQHEHYIYGLLHKAHIQVSMVYGLFKEDYRDSDATGLLMSYGGSSLEKSPTVTKKQRCVMIFRLFKFSFLHLLLANHFLKHCRLFMVLESFMVIFTLETFLLMMQARLL